MAPAPNPYAAPVPASGGAVRQVPLAEVPDEPEHGTIDLVENAGAKRSWTMALGRSEAWLVPPDAAVSGLAFALTHLELGKHCDVLVGAAVRGIVVRGAGPRAVVFRLDRDGMEALRRWMGVMPDVHVGAALKKRHRYSVPVGALVTLTALPILGTTVDPFALTFGLGLLAVGIIGPLRPHAALFAVHALLWFSLGISNARVALNGSTFSLFFALLCVWFGAGALRAFAFYRGLRAPGDARARR